MNDAKKIIILYSTAGMGHKKAAMALLESFSNMEDVDVEAIDIVDHATRLYKFLYIDLYVFLMKHARWLWGVLYYFSNNRIVDLVTRKLREISDLSGVPSLCDIVIRKRPDAVVATHFFLPSIAAKLVKNKEFHAKLFTLITDYGPHAYWLSRHMQWYFVGSDSTRDKLSKRGVKIENITVSGIPCNKDFTEDLDKDAIRGTYALDSEKKTVFLISGGFGVGPISKILLSLNSCKAEIQVIVVCGHNEKTYKRIVALKKLLRYKIVLFGFTDKVAGLMAVSDVMITKAGGISVSEAMNSHLPMILFGSIPGQETWNEQFLISNSAAEKAEDIKDIPGITDNILLSDEAYRSMVAGLESICKPDAAKTIVDKVMAALPRS